MIDRKSTTNARKATREALAEEATIEARTGRTNPALQRARDEHFGEEHGWVTCAPGDPNDKQLEFVRKMAGDQPFSVYLYNTDTGAVRVRIDDKFAGKVEHDVDTDGKGWSPLHGKYLVIDLTANNAHSYPDRNPPPDFGWGVCRQGYGLQEFGDGYMTKVIAEARAAVLNEGKQPATDVENNSDEELRLIKAKRAATTVPVLVPNRGGRIHASARKIGQERGTVLTLCGRSLRVYGSSSNEQAPYFRDTRTVREMLNAWETCFQCRGKF